MARGPGRFPECSAEHSCDDTPGWCRAFLGCVWDVRHPWRDVRSQTSGVRRCARDAGHGWRDVDPKRSGVIAILLHGYARTAGGPGFNGPGAPLDPGVPKAGSMMLESDSRVAIVGFETNRSRYDVARVVRRWYTALGFRTAGPPVGLLRAHVQYPSAGRDVELWERGSSGR